MKNEVVGIDLGTTTTLLSIYDPERGAEVVENDQGKITQTHINNTLFVLLL
jgi:molecular chaperone DnaK (HSP70)